MRKETAMNSTLADTREAQVPVHKQGHRGRLIRRSLAALAAAAVLTFGVAGSAQPASAASGVSYCFTHTNGGAYTYDVYLQIYTTSGWVTVTNVGRSANGCNTVNITGAWRNNYVRMMAYTRVGSYQFIGFTPLYASPGNYTYNLGTGWVNM